MVLIVAGLALALLLLVFWAGISSVRVDWDTFPSQN